MWITHNVTLLDLAKLLKEAGDFVFAEAWVNAGNKKVGSRVSSAFFTVLVTVFITVDASSVH